VSDVELFAAGSLAAREMPRYEQAAMTFLLRYRNVHTRTGYARSLRQWFDWCTGRGLDPLEAKRVDIEMWQRLCEAAGNKSTTVAAKVNALVGYYRLACVDEYIDKDPTVHLMRVKVPRESSTNGLTRAQLYEMLEQALQASKRDHALICLLGLNGLRISEVLNIDIEDLGFDRGHNTVTVTRKGGKEQHIPFCARTAWAVFEQRGDRTTGPLFVRADGLRLTRQSAGYIVKRIGRLAGVPQNISPHSLRHAFVTLALDAGVAPRDVQLSTGHASLAMVSYYDRRRETLDRNATHALAAFVAGMS